MTKTINLTIDHVKVSVPEGTLVVDAAKKAGINIPVFCYHPKMEPVGMCRQCLVEIGVHVETLRQRCIKIGERLGRLDDRPIPKGCTSSYAPEWIAAILKRSR